MTLSVYQHWDPLKICVVGKSYPPEFYSWINIPHVRKLFEKIAIETEEDYQAIIKKLHEFGVQVLRPNLPTTPFINGKYLPPPMNPRDISIMIGSTFYTCMGDVNARFVSFYNNVKDKSWPECTRLRDFYELPTPIQDECQKEHQFDTFVFDDPYKNIVEYIKQQGNVIKPGSDLINGAMVSRIGKDLYFGTLGIGNHLGQIDSIANFLDKEFTDTRNHVVNTGGHSDATYCPVCPGLIISLRDVPRYKDTFPGWEVVYLPGQSWDKVMPFIALKEKNKGKWWIPGFEHDNDVIKFVESWLSHWTGYVEETVFDVNMLIVDPKNVIVFNYNDQVFKALDRYGITPHVVPFRHRYFWDGGIHCVTSDLHREGTMQDYFPERNNV